MNIKAKACKGINKAKDFEGCGKMVVNRKYGLCFDCFRDWLLNTTKGKETLKKSTLKAKTEVKKEQRKETERVKAEITNWKDKLQKKVQEIARLIDYGLPCLARGNSKQIHGGHILAKGGNSNCRFNLHNIHRQGAHSNHFQNDDGVLRDGLRNEYGSQYHNFVIGLKQTPQPTFDNLDYKEFYRVACKCANELKADLRQRSLRNKINLEIGFIQNSIFKKQNKT